MRQATSPLTHVAPRPPRGSLSGPATWRVSLGLPECRATLVSALPSWRAQVERGPPARGSLHASVWHRHSRRPL